MSNDLLGRIGTGCGFARQTGLDEFQPGDDLANITGTVVALVLTAVFDKLEKDRRQFNALPRRFSLRLPRDLGRRVMLVYQGLLAAGRHELAVEAVGWAPGIYLARLTTPNAARSHRMVVTR